MSDTPNLISEMNDRSREVFRRVVEGYLASGDPVGSRTLTRTMTERLSAATIRNVTGTGITNVQFFQFLHGVQSERGVYDNHLHTGPSSAFQYDVTRRAWMLGPWARAVRVPAWKTSSAFTRACRRALSSSGTTASKAMAWTITSAASLRRSVLPVQSTSPCSRWPGCRP